MFKWRMNEWSCEKPLWTSTNNHLVATQHAPLGYSAVGYHPQNLSSDTSSIPRHLYCCRKEEAELATLEGLPQGIDELLFQIETTGSQYYLSEIQQIQNVLLIMY